MTETPREKGKKPNALLRPFFFVAGILFTGLGIFGLVSPGFPGVVFLILAAGCFTRSSPRLETWLLTHPKLGPPVVAWRENGSIPRSIKYVAIGSMFVSMAIICLSPAPRWVDWLMGAIMLASALFVGTRPEGPKAAR